MFLIVPLTNADIIDRGNGLIYDSDEDLTWPKDANINGTSKSDGWMPQSTATKWVEDLVYAGFDDWRLPVTTRGDDPTCPDDVRADTNFGPVIFYERHHDCLGGEMEMLTAHADPFNNPLFKKVVDKRYWTATPYRDGLDPCVETDTCTIENDNGKRTNFFWQWAFDRKIKTTLGAGNSRPVWPVRDGDVVPEDSSGVLMANLDIHSPSLDYTTNNGTLNIWANLSLYGTGPNNELLWKLVAFGVNKKPFTGAMTGIVTEQLDITIPGITLDGVSYWGEFEYYGTDKGEFLWKLTNYGTN